MPEKISFSWDMHYVCNYRCPYCWWEGRWHQLAKFNHYRPIKEIIGYWQKIYDRYGCVDIELQGGEPLIYPNFEELIKEISNLHIITIATNLSGDIVKFLRGINSSRVKINSTFHPLFAECDHFIDKSIRLKESGFLNKISYLAYPPQLKLMPHFKDKFAINGLSFETMTFWGKYNGKDYPGSYTQEEQIISQAFKNEAADGLQLNRKETTKGKLCPAGCSYAVISPDGAVLRCRSLEFSEEIGNFYDEKFSLLNNPLPCNHEYCNCNRWFSPAESSFPSKVFFTWDVHYACNYKCSYCTFANKWDEMAKENTYPAIDKLIKNWEEVYYRYGSCHIHISGGEPSIYPGFMDLLSSLCKYHSVEIDTNLSFDVFLFMDKVKAGKIRLSPAFHPEYADIKSFLHNVAILKKNDYDIEAVNYVAFPLQLKDMKEYKKRFVEIGMGFVIQPFRGTFDNREYPNGYLPEEMNFLEECGLSDVSKGMSVWYQQEEEKKERKNKLCKMGQMYAKIHANGNVYRCCMVLDDGYLGNLFKGDFKLYSEPKICEYPACHCFKAMIAGKEHEWRKFWDITV